MKELSADAVRQQMEKELAVRERVQLLAEPLPSALAAKRAVKEGRARFEDRVALLRHFAAAQQWTPAREQLDKAEELAPGKAGMRWLRYAFLHVSRRHE